MFTLYNTLNRKKEKFVPLKQGKVGIYSCGPTVYNVAHVGNLSSFIFVDLLRRWLEYREYKVTHVMNVTDVEDKIIRSCSKTMANLREYTGRFTALLFEDLKRLNIKTAEVYPRATDHIQEMVDLIKILLDLGYAYHKDGSVYFRINAFPAYGKFAGMDMKNLKVGVRVDADEYDKDDARDFVLWKGWKPDEDGQIYWDTEIGYGRPGWHIECSAMSMKYLGETIDIHTGGIDLVFPHHQNEIAQSEAVTGKQFVRYRLHREFLNISGSKMSKSAGSGASLSAIAPQLLDATAFRYLVVTSHYRSPLNLTEKSMESARNAVINLRNLYSRLSSVNTSGENQIANAVNLARLKFGEAMDDDLGSPRAMAAFFEFLSVVEKMMQEKSLTKASAQSAQSFIQEIDFVLGVNIDAQADRVLTQEESELIKEREDARKLKNWKRADEVRIVLMEKGIHVEDTAQGTRCLFA